MSKNNNNNNNNTQHLYSAFTEIAQCAYKRNIHSQMQTHLAYRFSTFQIIILVHSNEINKILNRKLHKSIKIQNKEMMF